MSAAPPAGPVAAPAAPAIPLAAPVPPVAPASPVTPVVALGPGCNNNILDFSQTQHIKTYYKATSPITTDDHFDGTTVMVTMFLSTIQDNTL